MPETNSYDQVPYNSKPYGFTQPDRLGAVGWLYGIEPASADRCRMLEIGCASGGNLIPLAERYPQSEFVGLDLSPRQIADGQTVTHRLGLGNMTLQTGDLLEIGPELGQFDYIVAHGVYSWIPPHVADKLLAVCADHLSPQGLAVISYSTYPGGHFRQMTRELLKYRSRGLTDPNEIVREGRAALDFLAESVPARGDGYRAWLRTEASRLRERTTAYIFHDNLEENNNPCYFHEFVERAQRHRLKYVADGRLVVSQVTSLPADQAAKLRSMAADPLELEQYVDFFFNTMLRASVLCRGDGLLKPVFSSRRMLDLHVACAAKSAEPIDVNSSAPAVFVGQGGQITASDPALKAMFMVLGEHWPAAMPVRELAGAVGQRAGTAIDDERIARMLIDQLHSLEIQVGVQPSDFITAVSDRPLASPCARFQAETGDSATNRQHSSVPLDELTRQLLRRLDGRHDRAALCEELSALIASGSVPIPPAFGAGADRTSIRQALDQSMEHNLLTLAQKAFLIG